MNSAVVLRTIGLLMLSNGFMLFAWYGHLKTLGAKPWYVAAIISWSIALFEYLLQVPANRIGFTTLSLAQLKIVQEIVTLAVFVPVRALLHAPAAQARLPLGELLSRRRRVLRVPQLTPAEKFFLTARDGTATVRAKGSPHVANVPLDLIVCLR